METNAEQMFINVRKCIRCGEDHSLCLFKKLTNPPDEYEWWGMCPLINEPILLRIVTTE